MSVAEGFPGQRLHVLPRPVAARALGRPGTRALLVTDCGFFPQARAHGLERAQPIRQAVVLLCTAGRGWCTIGGTTHSVAAGQVVVIPQGQPHAYGSELDDPWTLWWMHLDGSELAGLLAPGGAVGPAPVRTPSNFFQAVSMMEEVVGQMEADVGPPSLFAATAAAWHFLSALASGTGAHGPRSGVIERARDHLQSNLSKRASVAELAAMAKLSPSHFAALFREQVGLPVLQYQTQLRMQRARELLDTTELPVAKIAAVLGYADAFYFSRQFRAVHGTTPMRYRSQSKG